MNEKKKSKKIKSTKKRRREKYSLYQHLITSKQRKKIRLKLKPFQ